MSDHADEDGTGRDSDAPVADAAGTLARWREVVAAIARSCDDAERELGAVTLVAVSKTFPSEAIVPLLEAGQRVFGENRVQEAKAKWPGLRERFPGLELHLIGPLQTNKAKEAVELFDVIETVDRERIAAELGKQIAQHVAKGGTPPRLLVQVNTGDEPQKAGVSPRDADAFIAACRERFGLAIGGLMCIPPAEDPPSPHFALLAAIAARHGLAELSMGMSADFEAAIQMGATHVRVGSAIFGHR